MILLSTKTNIANAAQIIRDGRLIGMPTETVYGLAGDATNPDAAQNIYSLKRRPSSNPLIVHYHSYSQVKKDAIFTPKSLILAKKLWPGPLTLILERSPQCSVSSVATANLSTIAVRVPSHPIAQEILLHANVPVIAPSANISGLLSPVSAEHVALMSESLPIIDGGRCDSGLESTIVDMTDDDNIQILRFGAISKETIESILKQSVLTPYDTQITPHSTLLQKAPGTMHQHYAPNYPLHINVTHDAKTNDEGLISFGKIKLNGYKIELNLSSQENLNEAANNIFAFLHAMNKLNISSVSVTPIPNIGLGCAINDRILRASNKL